MLLDLFERICRNQCFEADGGGASGGSEDGKGGTDTGKDTGTPEKTFTQEELNKIAAAEKRQGAASVYKELGFDSPEEAKKAIEAWRKAEEEKKTELEKAQGALELEKKAKDAALSKASELEKKMSILSMGVDAKNVGDVMTLANSRVNESTTFEKALEDVKKSFPNLFSSSAGTGTGGQPPRGQGGGTESRAQRLAKQRLESSKTQQNVFFQH